MFRRGGDRVGLYGRVLEELVYNPQEAVVESSVMVIRTGMDGSLSLDGRGRMAGLGENAA